MTTFKQCISLINFKFSITRILPMWVMFLNLLVIPMPTFFLKLNQPLCNTGKKLCIIIAYFLLILLSSLLLLLSLLLSVILVVIIFIIITILIIYYYHYYYSCYCVFCYSCHTPHVGQSEAHQNALEKNL